MENGEDWLESEPGLSDVVTHAARLFRRARVRWVTTLAVTILCVAAAIAVRLHERRTFHAAVVLRVSEDEIDATTEPETNELKEALEDVAFSSPNLLRIIRAHGLYRGKLAKDPQAAVEAMRDDMEVQMARNYFLAERGVYDPPRTALVTIDYRSEDPEEALAVVHDLTSLAVNEENRTRREMARVAAQDLDTATRTLQNRKIADQDRIAVLQRRLGTADPFDRADVLVELEGLHRDLEATDGRLRDFAPKAGALDLRAAMEDRAVGVRFEVVDTTPPKTPWLPRRYELALLAVGSFAMFLPLVALAVGAADRRIRETSDVRALGLEPLGHLPAPT